MEEREREMGSEGRGSETQKKKKKRAKVHGRKAEEDSSEKMEVERARERERGDLSAFSKRGSRRDSCTLAIRDFTAPAAPIESLSLVSHEFSARKPAYLAKEPQSDAVKDGDKGRFPRTLSKRGR